MRIGLVGCVKEKRNEGAALPAEDLYVSPLFRGRRAYVVRTCDEWFILSAKHGLVHPDTMLEPYDVTLKDAARAERRRWSKAVLDGLRDRLGDLAAHTFEIHAGAEYRDFGLRSGLAAAGAVVEIPTEGLSLGQQLAFYREVTAEGPKGTGDPPVRSREGGPPAHRQAHNPGGVPVDPLHVIERTQGGPGGSTYAPLGEYLAGLKSGRVDLTFAEIERLLGRALPRSSRRYREWWGNDRSHSHARAWLDAGWRVDLVNLSAERVRFAR